ncbi:MAG: hypothetical protein OXE94_01555 [Aestuariivita sp.]|nr:hypothetical protein [Aestuariivita sp.]MCY4201530.1 hypothetical protein [Aestuariivita sp.]
MTVHDNPRPRDLPKDVAEILKAEADREKKLRSNEKARHNKLAKPATADLDQASDPQRATIPRRAGEDFMGAGMAVLSTGFLSGVLLTLTFVIVAILLHTNALRIIETFPQLMPLYDAYVSTYENFITWLNAWFESGLG